MLKEQLSPWDIDISKRLANSDFASRDKETVACSIIAMSRTSSSWRPFTFEGVCKSSGHPLGPRYETVLDQLVTDGLLKKDTDSQYTVKDAFIAKLWKFVTTS